MILPHYTLEAFQCEAGKAGDQAMVDTIHRARAGDLHSIGVVLDAMEPETVIHSWREPHGVVSQAVSMAIKASLRAGGLPVTLCVRPREYPAAKAELFAACELERGNLFVGASDHQLWAVRLIGDDAVIPRASR